MEAHPIYEKNRVFILDTTYTNKELIVNNHKPPFIITDYSNMWTTWTPYWLHVKKIEFGKHKVKYQFETQSLHRNSNIKFLAGEVTLKRKGEKWEIVKINYAPYDYVVPMDDECFTRTADCKETKLYPLKSNNNNPLFGNWQFMWDNEYIEVFISDDSIYHYSEFGFTRDLRYEIADSFLITYPSGEIPYKRTFTIINNNKIQIQDNYWVVDGNDTIITPVTYIMNKINNRKYCYNDVRCWSVWNEGLNCFIDSEDFIKFQNEFFKRSKKYMSKIEDNF